MQVTGTSAALTVDIADVEKGTAGGFGHVVGDGSLSFADLLDALNPLQHVPIVSHVYRAITGDTIKPAMKVAGGLLYGGPAGALTAAGAAIAEQMLGAAPEEAPSGRGNPAAATVEAADRGEPAAAAALEQGPAAPATGAGSLRRDATAGKDIRTYIQDAMPGSAPRPVPANLAAAPGAQAQASPGIQNVPPWFAERMLGALDKYREQANPGADELVNPNR